MIEPALVEDAVLARADELFRPGEPGQSWLVLHVRPRCEKRAAKACADLKVRHYLPLHRRHHPPRKGQRGYSFDVPLFPGYVFVCCDPGERYRVLLSGQVVATLEVVNQAELLDELRNVFLAASRPVELALYPQLRRGRRVRVTAGPLKGVVGRITERRQGLRLVLNITMLGTAVAAEIDMSQVEPV